MANYPHTFMGQQTLQPGARGEIFQADLPGYRGQGDRINRTNMKLAVSEHDVPNVKWELDKRLPVLFRYGFANGFNQIVLPKGRLVAIDKSLNILDTDSEHSFNALTMANGGADVVIRKDGYTNVQETETKAVGVGTQWAPINASDYIVGEKTVSFRPFKPLAEGETRVDVTIDPDTGLAIVNKQVRTDVRVGNTPIGIIERNEYTRNANAMNGMNVGPVLTNKLIELPMFLVKEKAEMNPWGSAYGQFVPGDLVKSDENGRVIVSPLSIKADVMEMTAGEIELERQQVVGQVFAVSRDLVPVGAAKYAQWALSDRLNFDEFNPEVWRANNRDGEDNISKSPYGLGGDMFSNNSGVGGKVTGYPYDRTASEHDMHMLASSARTSSNRFGLEHMMEQGIPGLTDGYNAVIRDLAPEELGKFGQAIAENEYVEMMFKTADVSLEEMEIAIVTTEGVPAENAFVTVNESAIDQKVALDGLAAAMVIKYVSLKQGHVTIGVNPEKQTEVHAALAGKKARVIVKCKKRGMTGVPTNLDWDGCAGVLTVLLQK